MEVKCICMASVCSICRDHPTPLVGLVEEIRLARGLGDGPQAHRRHRDEEQGDE